MWRPSLRDSTRFQRATVYVLFDAEDRVLYVGMTRAGINRFAGHQVDKPWWTDVVRAELHHVGTQWQAKRAEALLIRDLKPIHNVNRPLDECSNCGFVGTRANGRCQTCRSYFEKHGQERPEHLILAAQARKQARDWVDLAEPIKVRWNV